MEVFGPMTQCDVIFLGVVLCAFLGCCRSGRGVGSHEGQWKVGLMVLSPRGVDTGCRRGGDDSRVCHRGPGKAFFALRTLPGHSGHGPPGPPQEFPWHLFPSIHIVVVFRKDSFSNDETVSRHFMKNPET